MSRCVRHRLCCSPPVRHAMVLPRTSLLPSQARFVQLASRPRHFLWLCCAFNRTSVAPVVPLHIKACASGTVSHLFMMKPRPDWAKPCTAPTHGASQFVEHRFLFWWHHTSQTHRIYHVMLDVASQHHLSGGRDQIHDFCHPSVRRRSRGYGARFGRRCDRRPQVMQCSVAPPASFSIDFRQRTSLLMATRASLSVLSCSTGGWHRFLSEYETLFQALSPSRLCKNGFICFENFRDVHNPSVTRRALLPLPAGPMVRASSASQLASLASSCTHCSCNSVMH